MSDLEIREETPADFARIDVVERAAFGRGAEARLVRALRASASPWLSLVAVRADETLGHVGFSPVRIEGPGPAPPAGGLAPLAVLPEAQGQGIGGALVRAGIQACRPLGWQAIFLLGDPGYYARFGFVPAQGHGLIYESEAFAEAFQLLELVPGALSGRGGRVHYHPAFASLEEPTP